MSQQQLSPTDPVLESRMLPRVSIGFLFLLTTLGALVAAAAQHAGEGDALAIAVVAALGFLAACFAIFAVLFLWCRLAAALFGWRVNEMHQGNPFADGQLPPQLVPPREPPS